MARKGKIAHLRGEARNVSQTYLYDTPEASLHSSKPLGVYEVLSKVFRLESTKNVELFARVKNSEI